jgi:glycosyltransferase involved in cell wall biosynthesis
MKVIYFAEHFTTPKTGGGVRPYQMAQRLLSHGHQVTMVCGGDHKLFDLSPTNNKNIYRGSIDGIDVIQISLPYSNYDSLAKRAMTFLRFAYKAMGIALKENYDLLFATSTPLTDGLPGIVAKWFRKKKFVFEVRDLWPEIPQALGLKNPLFLWGMSVLEKRSYHAADGCIGLSPGICEGIKRRSQKGKPIAMVPNGCDLDLFSPSDNKPDVIPGVQPSDAVAVFTGAHGVANGLDAVLNMAAVLRQRGRNDIKMVFVGDGKMKPSLQERAKREGLDNCIFLGHMPKKELNEVMQRADIGMMILANVPAFYYGTSPNKFFDYIASGLPVVNNYPGWLADMINENQCGIAVEPDNPVLFADAMERLSDNPGLRKTFGKNGRALAEREFARDKLGTQFVSFLEQVYNKKSN